MSRRVKVMGSLPAATTLTNLTLLPLFVCTSSEHLFPGYRCSRDDKYLLVYTLLKLGLVKGKTLLFVSEIDRCYRYCQLTQQECVGSVTTYLSTIVQIEAVPRAIFYQSLCFEL